MSERKKPTGMPPQSKQFSSKQQKVFDIRRPGKTIALPTSRPIIARPMVKDSLLVNKPQVVVAHKSSPLRSPRSSEDDAQALMDPTDKVAVKPMQPDSPSAVAHDDLVSLLAGGKGQSQEQSRPAELAKEKPSAPSPAAAAELPALPASSALQQATTPGDNDVLASTIPPEVDMSRAVISARVTPHRRIWREVLVVIGLLLFVVAMLDILLDTGLLHLHGIPHTSFLTSTP